MCGCLQKKIEKRIIILNSSFINLLKNCFYTLIRYSNLIIESKIYKVFPKRTKLNQIKIIRNYKGKFLKENSYEGKRKLFHKCHHRV